MRNDRLTFRPIDNFFEEACILLLAAGLGKL